MKQQRPVSDNVPMLERLLIFGHIDCANGTSVATLDLLWLLLGPSEVEERCLLTGSDVPEDSSVFLEYSHRPWSNRECWTASRVNLFPPSGSFS